MGPTTTPGAGLIHDSDRGSQYAAADCRDIVQAAAEREIAETMR